MIHDIGWAIRRLWDGGRVRRTGWNGKGMFLELQCPDAHSKMSMPYAYISTPDDKLIPCSWSQADVLAVDWEDAPMLSRGEPEDMQAMSGYDRKPADSYGKRLVGFDFNPSGDPKVAKLKGLFAEIIDICADELAKLDVDNGPTELVAGPIWREAILRSLDAQMWTVKGATWRNP